MAPTTPTGSRTMSELPSSSSQSNSVICVAISAKAPVGRPTWMAPDRVIGIPTSREIVWAISSVRAARPSEIRDSILARSSTEVADQSAKASAAAWTALSTSSAVPSGMVAITSSLFESTTSSVPVPVEGTQAPPM